MVFLCENRKRSILVITLVAWNRGVLEPIVTFKMEIYSGHRKKGTCFDHRRCVSFLIAQAINQLRSWTASDSENDLWNAIIATGEHL